MPVNWILLFFCSLSPICFSQSHFPHEQAHAHNDYEHDQPLWTAVQNGFISVEADVHLQDGELLVSHGRPRKNALTLQQLYLTPLDSLLANNAGTIYTGYEGTFYLMIDCKTKALPTYHAIQQALLHYENLRCIAAKCPVKIFISGNRAIRAMMSEGYKGIALDGRPDDLGKGISREMMPVISDHFAKWSAWSGESEPVAVDLERVQALAQRVHAEGKKLRLWAIPDNERTWSALLAVGVDLINTDHIEELNKFLSGKDD